MEFPRREIIFPVESSGRGPIDWRFAFAASSALWILAVGMAIVIVKAATP